MCVVCSYVVGTDGARLVAVHSALVHVRSDGVHARAPAAQLPRVLVGPRALIYTCISTFNYTLLFSLSYFYTRLTLRSTLAIRTC